MPSETREECFCGWQEPYGFVPEADCAEHDNAEFVARMNLEFGSASAVSLARDPHTGGTDG